VRECECVIMRERGGREKEFVSVRERVSICVRVSQIIYIWIRFQRLQGKKKGSWVSLVFLCERHR
jgi:hypothetical protein